jgi:group I intron endonuclease
MDYKLDDLKVWDDKICNTFNKRWLIYKHTNSHTGKSYVGQTIFTMEKRWQGHLSSSFKKDSSAPFHNSIRKYGPDVWVHEVLEAHIVNIDMSNERETFWIEKFRTNEKEFGYNCDSGGAVHIVNDLSLIHI